MFFIEIDEIDPEGNSFEVWFGFDKKLVQRITRWVTLKDLTSDSLILFLTDEEILRLNPGNSESLHVCQKVLIDDLTQELTLTETGVKKRDELDLVEGDIVKANGQSGTVNKINGDQVEIIFWKVDKIVKKVVNSKDVKRKVKTSDLL